MSLLTSLAVLDQLKLTEILSQLVLEICRVIFLRTIEIKLELMGGVTTHPECSFLGHVMSHL